MLANSSVINGSILCFSQNILFYFEICHDCNLSIVFLTPDLLGKMMNCQWTVNPDIRAKSPCVNVIYDIRK